MTAAFENRPEWLTGGWDAIYQRAVDVFDCRMYASNGTARGAEGRRRHKKQAQIHSTIDRFRAVMSSPNPPRTKEEAVEAIAPILTLILSMLVKQFVIQVIEWLWAQLESSETSATVTAKGQ